MSYPTNTVPITAPVEKKTWAALVAGLAVGLLGAIANEAADPGNAALMDGLPAPVRFVIVVLVASLPPFLAAYSAPHTPRADPAAVQAGATPPGVVVNDNTNVLGERLTYEGDLSDPSQSRDGDLGGTSKYPGL